jgi:hypothetical protein
MYKLPTYRVSSKHYLRASLAALGMAIVSGLIWGVIGNFLPFFYLNLLLGPGVGYAIGEVVSLSVNRKRGIGLALTAGIAVILSYLVSIFFPWGLLLGGLHFSLFGIIFDLVALALGVFLAISRLR